MTMKKKILTTLSVVLILGLAALGILAYLTAEDSDVNVMTLGNVGIKQHEMQRADGVAHNATAVDGSLEKFEQEQALYPAVPKNGATTDYTAEPTDLFYWGPYVTADGAGNGLWNDGKLSNTLDKMIFVENTGKSDAYYRTLIAVECPEGITIGEVAQGAEIMLNVNGNNRFEWENDLGYITVDGARYALLVANYKEVIKPGEVSRPSLLQVVMTHNATNEDCALFGDEFKILALSQAAQTQGFANAQEALDTAFGDVTLANAEDWFSLRIDYTITGETNFEDIEKAFNEGGNIYISENVNLTNPASGNTYITTDKDVNIYAAEGAEIAFGETALFNGKGTITVYGGNLKTNHELCVTGDSELVIEGGEHSFGAFSATSNGKIVVNGGTLNCKGTYAGVMGISFAENGSLVINDGLLNMYQPFNLNANRCDKAYIEINGGHIELLGGMADMIVVRNIMDKDRTSGMLRGSSVRITGGTFVAHYAIDSDRDATAFIRNGDAPADTNKVLVSNTFNGNADYDCEVTGGTFYGSWQRADNQRYTGSDGNFVENTVAGFVSDGHQITGDATNGYVITKK